MGDVKASQPTVVIVASQIKTKKWHRKSSRRCLHDLSKSFNGKEKEKDINKQKEGHKKGKVICDWVIVQKISFLLVTGNTGGKKEEIKRALKVSILLTSMAEENIDSPITPEINGFDREYAGKGSFRKSGSLNNGHGTNSDHRRASMGSYHSGDNSTRNSTGKPDSLNSSQHNVPHYLRASTGSCHDFCKYGRKHAFEVKGRSPLLKRMTRPESNKQNRVETTLPAEIKKEMIIEHKLSPDSKIHSPGVKSNSPKCKPLLEAKIHSPDKKTSSGIKTGMRKHKPSPTTKTSSLVPPEIIKREILLPSREVEVELKRDTSTENKMPRDEKKTNNLSKKHSPSVQLKSVKVKPSSSPSDILDGIHGKGRNSSDVKTGRKLAAPRLSEGKKLAPATASLSPKISLSRTISLKARRARSLKPVSTLKDQAGMHKTETKISNDVKVPEKTLHVIKTEIGNNLLEFIPNGHVIPSLPPPLSPKSLSNAKSSSLSSHEQEEETEYTDSEADDFVSDYDTSEEVGRIETVEDNHKMTRRKSTVISEDKDGAPLKLKFRRGKVVDLQSDNSSPRRLRFRRGRVLGEDQNGKGDLKRRIFKKGGSNDDKNGTGPSSRKVVLKHQDVQGKKDAQGLFNNVIEETAILSKRLEGSSTWIKMKLLNEEKMGILTPKSQMSVAATTGFFSA
ncbi:Plant calmodulin-binding protein-related [Abeliophyllum distichum]|uniref:Plant calmodulin-binding protein-related n=1 Tax=Abeliophyllum distichum TaxID=126358 RepID=A0ABD1SX25_9LAMI